MFSTSYCPWCAKQTKVLKKLQEKRKNFQFIKVKDDSAVYKELLKKYAFVIEVYPTSYLVYKKDDIININYEFQGYQKEKNILDVIDDKDNF